MTLDLECSFLNLTDYYFVSVKALPRLGFANVGPTGWGFSDDPLPVWVV